MDKMMVHGLATGLHIVLKAYKIPKKEGFFPCEWFDHLDRMQISGPSPYDAVPQ